MGMGIAPRSVQPHRRAALRQADHTALGALARSTSSSKSKTTEAKWHKLACGEMRDVKARAAGPTYRDTHNIAHRRCTERCMESAPRLQEIAFVPLLVRLGGAVQEHGRPAEEDELGRVAGRGLDRLLVWRGGQGQGGPQGARCGAVWGHGRVQPRAAVAAAHAECPRAPSPCVAV